jgi:phosphoribosylaminoimidazolecarboxamide formyltransferase/IMP cyclohydrolase
LTENVTKPACKRALISLSDKTGLTEFARELIALGYHLVSTGGTARALIDAGVQVEKVEDLTGFPEIMDGRVKTLHPKIHAGILARDRPEDWAQLEKLGIEPFDLVVVNLYPFRETIAKPNVLLGDAIEKIDIGGPSMVRAAAKNFTRVAIIVNPECYGQVLRELRESGQVKLSTRLELAREAFWHTAVYDSAIANYLYSLGDGEGQEVDLESTPVTKKFPDRLTVPLTKLNDLRYGENPHQQAAFYREENMEPHGIAGAQQLNGKELSCNNILDLNAALGAVMEFTAAPAAVVIKHSTPSGVAEAKTLAQAFFMARQANAEAAYGGVVGLNRVVDIRTARALTETFLEAIVAPAYDAEALAELREKKNLRILAAGDRAGMPGGWDMKRVSGGFLLQDSDITVSLEDLKKNSRVVTDRAPSEAEWADLLFGWLVVKHAYSNGIVLAKGKVTLGIGSGQVSRVASVNIALEQAGAEAGGSALASDGFFPFPDSIENAALHGVTAVIQPGHSIRDEEVIAVANAAGIAMVFTGKRHFKH